MTAPWIFIWIFSYLWILMKHHSSASQWNGTKLDLDPSFSRTKSGSPTNLLKTATRGNASTSIMDSDHPGQIFRKEPRAVDPKNIKVSDILKEDDKAVCEPTRSSCENLCGVEEARWDQLLCSCDVYCLIYDTCCEDFKQVCPETWQESKTMFPHLMNLKTQCLTQSPVSHLIIASCSDSPNLPLSDQIRKDCEDAMPENPVTIGHFHFKNIDCLRCNGFNETEAIVWSLHISLQSEYKHIWTTGPKFIANFKSLEASQAWMLPSAIPPTPISKLCRASIIDSCPVGTELEMKKKCEGAKSYVLPKPDNGVTIYSNKYCLACNHDNETGCRSALISDFQPDSHSGPVTLVRWTPFNNGKKGGVVMSTVKMLWKTLECRGDYTDRPTLNCTIRDCFDFILLLDGVCSVDNVKVCLWLEITWWNVTARGGDGTDNTEATVAGLAFTVKDILEWYIHKAYQYPKWSYDIMGASIRFKIDTIRGVEGLSRGPEHTRIAHYVTGNLSEKGYVGNLSVCFDTEESTCQMKFCGHVETYEIPQLSHLASGYYRNTRASWYLLVLYLLKLTIG